MSPVRFMGDSRTVLRLFPDEVKSEIGFALERVQQGKMPVNAKPLKGVAPGVQEITSDFKSGTFRAVYTVRPESSLCFARVPKEVQTGHRNAEK
jgi:phage-related protein